MTYRWTETRRMIGKVCERDTSARSTMRRTETTETSRKTDIQRDREDISAKQTNELTATPE